jgi:hypothetical protein
MYKMACRTSADAGREAPRVRDEPASMEHLQMHLECAITTYKYTSMQGMLSLFVVGVFSQPM